MRNQPGKYEDLTHKELCDEIIQRTQACCIVTMDDIGVGQVGICNNFTSTATGYQLIGALEDAKKRILNIIEESRHRS